MNRILTHLLFCLTLIGVPAAASAADLPVLTVYTYNSFISDWGPGPQVKKAFEAGCAWKGPPARPMWCWVSTPT